MIRELSSGRSMGVKYLGVDQVVGVLQRWS